MLVDWVDFTYLFTALCGSSPGLGLGEWAIFQLRLMLDGCDAMISRLGHVIGEVYWAQLTLPVDTEGLGGR